MIALLGTGHVFNLRRRLQREVLARAPDVVGLELDAPRLQALLARKRGRDAPLAYRLLADFQERVAGFRDVAAGDEMIAAYEAARQAGVAVELIDLDARAAFGRLWGEMGWFERARFLGSAFAASLMPRRVVEKELGRLEGDYSGLLEQLARDYPTVKRVLLDERDAHMAARLAALRAQGRERVVAVMGDAHVDGVRRALEARGFGAELEAVRLRELRGPEVQGPGASAGFTTEVEWG